MEHLGAQNSGKHKKDQLSPRVLQISWSKGAKITKKEKKNEKRKYYKRKCQTAEPREEEK